MADTASAPGASAFAASTDYARDVSFPLREVLWNVGVVVLENTVEFSLQLRLLNVGDHGRRPAVEEENGRLRRLR